jgi:hypothetical protein
MQAPFDIPERRVFVRLQSLPGRPIQLQPSH